MFHNLSQGVQKMNPTQHTYKYCPTASKTIKSRNQIDAPTHHHTSLSLYTVNGFFAISIHPSPIHHAPNSCHNSRTRCSRSW